MPSDNPSGAGNQQERPGLEQWVVGFVDGADGADGKGESGGRRAEEGAKCAAAAAWVPAVHVVAWVPADLVAAAQA
jgi:hypothetical protein